MSELLVPFEYNYMVKAKWVCAIVGGIILAMAMLVGPRAIAYLLSDSFERMLMIAMAVAIGSSVAGTLINFHIDGATGPCIVLIQMVIFVGAFLLAPQRGLLWRGRANPRGRAEDAVAPRFGGP